MQSSIYRFVIWAILATVCLCQSHRLFTVTSSADSAANETACLQVDPKGCNIRSAIAACEGTCFPGDVCELVFAKYISDLYIEMEFGSVAVASGSEFSLILSGDGQVVQAVGQSHKFISAYMSPRLNISVSDLTIQGFVNPSSFSSGGAFNFGVIGSISFSNVTFTGNSAGYGGVMYSSNCKSYLFHRCLFKNNGESYSGAAINIKGEANNVLISECEFINNAAEVGGAIVIEDVEKGGFIVDCLFSGNRAEEIGGAIMLDRNAAYFAIHNCSFESNTAEFGSAIYLAFENTDTFIVNSSFYENSASVEGAIFVDSGVYGTVVLQCYFERNFARNGAGVAVGEYAEEVAVYDSTFYNNTAYTAGAVRIGKLASVIHIENSTFTDNTALEAGGALLLAEDAVLVSIISCVFERNYGAYRGGAVSVFEGSLFLHVMNCSFRQNTAALGGAIEYQDFNLLLIVRFSAFFNNFASDKGGALAVHSANDVIAFHECVLTDNSAGTEGGAFYIYDANTNIQISSCMILNNAAQNGGAIYLSSNNEILEVTDSIIEGNTAAGDGGAISLEYQNSEIIIRDCTLTKNEALFAGGAFFCALSTSYITVSNSILHDNSAYYGSAIYLGTGTYDVDIISTNVTSNRALLVGGAFYFDIMAQYISISKSHVVRNRAFSSAAIFNKGNYITVDECTITDNFNDESNGVINSEGAGLFISNTYLGNNSIGGAITIKNSVFVGAENCTFQDNIGVDGGALHIETTTSIVLLDNYFFGNSAQISGGAVSIVKSEKCVLFRGRFSRNDGYNGGGADFNEVDSILIRNVTFTEQRAFTGGALSFTGCLYAFIADNDFFFNTVVQAGSAIYGYGSVLIIFRNFFSENYVSNGGGTVYWSYFSGMDEPSRLTNGSNVFVGNWALYGSLYATEGVRTSLAMETSSGDIAEPTTHGASGENYYLITDYENPLPTLYITLVDYYGSTVLNENSGLSRAEVTSSYCGKTDGYLTGDTVDILNNGGAEFNYLDAHCVPTGNLTFRISTTVLLNEFPVDMRLSFRSCKRGEYYDNTGSCVECPEGKYSIDVTSRSECKTCPEYSQTCHGDEIKVKRGFWRISENSSAILQCLLIEKGCLGGWETGDESCAEGFEGPLCSVCSDGYYLSSVTFSCELCGNAYVSPIGVVSLIFLSIAFFIVIWYFLTLRRIGIPTPFQFFNLIRGKCSYAAADDNPKSDKTKFSRHPAVVKLKIYVTLYQIVGSMAYILDYQFPSGFNAIRAALNILNFGTSEDMGLSCSMPFDYIDVLVVTTTAPIIVVCGLGVLYRLQTDQFGLKCFPPLDSEAQTFIKSTYYYLLLFFTYLIFPGVSAIICRTFSCQNIDKNDEDSGDNFYLRADYSISCTSERYYFGFIWASVMVFVYPFGIPAYYAYVLQKEKECIKSRYEPKVGEGQLRRTKILFARKFLFEAYKPQYWYFEVVEACQKLFFTGFLVFLSPGSSGQVVAGGFVALLYMKIYTDCAPFEDKFSGWSKNLAQWQLFVIFVIILLSKEEVLDVDGGVLTFLFLFSVSANALFDVGLGVKYGSTFWSKNLDAISLRRELLKAEKRVDNLRSQLERVTMATGSDDAESQLDKSLNPLRADTAVELVESRRNNDT